MGVSVSSRKLNLIVDDPKPTPKPATPDNVPVFHHSNCVLFPEDANERTLIIDTWSLIEDKTKFGQQVFLHIFMAKPNLKRHFNLETYTADQLPTAPRFCAHAANFSSLINLAVVNMSQNKEAITRQLIQSIGAKHVLFLKNFKFDIDYWLFFTEAVVDQLTSLIHKRSRNNRYKPIELRRIWIRLLRLIVDDMKTGYIEQTLKLARLNCSISE